MSAREPETKGLTCREVVSLLADYLESAFGQKLTGELEKHLTGCEPCRAYLNTYRRTKTLTAETERGPMPEKMKDRLRQFLLRALSNGAVVLLPVRPPETRPGSCA